MQAQAAHEAEDSQGGLSETDKATKRRQKKDRQKKDREVAAAAKKGSGKKGSGKGIAH